MKNIWKVVILIILLVFVIFFVWLIADRSILSNEEIIQKVDMIENANSSVSYTKTFEDNLTVEIFGDKEYFNIFETDIIAVSGLVTGSSVTLIPYPDFIDTQEFHYYPDGTLALYVAVSNTIGGEVKYYFYNNKLIDVKNELEEPTATPQILTEDELLARAKLVYERYLK